MQFGLDQLFKMVEQRFGRGTSTATLALMLVTLVIFCVNIIITQGVKPAYETVSAWMQGGPVVLPENVLAISISALVLGVVPIIGAFVAARLFIANVHSQLALATQQQRASLEIKYSPEPPYRVQSGTVHRIGIYNHGPSMATDAQVWLLRIEPSNALPDHSLPGNFLWPDTTPHRSTIRPQMSIPVERDSRNIAPGQELQLNVLRTITISSSEPGGPRYGAVLFIVNSGAVTGMDDGEECRLYIQATALNATPILATFVLRREGDRMTCKMVDASSQAMRQ